MPAKYNPVGALNGLFAPAYIKGDPQSEAAVAAWNAANLKKPPADIPVPPPVSNPGGGFGGRLNPRDLIARRLMMLGRR